MSAPRLGLALVALVVVALAALPRFLASGGLEIPGQERWTTSDADSFFHLRQLVRTLDEGEVPTHDPFLNHPRGAKVPWPPYYTALLALVLGPFAPEAPPPVSPAAPSAGNGPSAPRADDGSPAQRAGEGAPPQAEVIGRIEERALRDAWIEMRACSVPAVLGVLTSLLAALLAARVAPAGLAAVAAIGAGTYHAFCRGSLQYSGLGNGDHHAWISFLLAAMLLVLTAGLARGALERPRAALGYGIAAGALAGVMLGSWVAALLYVLCVQACLGLFVLRHARHAQPGLASLGLGFHLAALATVMPAVLDSPWRADHPWMVVNLSWFHPLLLALGALVFVPLPWLAPGSAARRRYPYAVAGLLALLALFVVLDPWLVGPALREGFDWMGRGEAFMATIAESRPLLGAGALPGELWTVLGYGALALPPAMGWLAWRAWRRGEPALLPLAVAAPALLLQALQQKRFADALAPVMAAVLGWALAELWATWRRAGRARAPEAVRASRARSAWVGALLACGLALAAHAGASVLPAARAIAARGGATVYTPSQMRLLGVRECAEWLRRYAPRERGTGVLANWGFGHLLEWSARQPTVATNFGSYAGEDGFRAAPQFLLEEDEDEAESILRERRARFVLVTSEWPAFVADMLKITDPRLWARYIAAPFGKRGALEDEWFETMGARLLFGGQRFHPGKGTSGSAPDYLRLVQVSTVQDPAPALAGAAPLWPSAFLWERVAGARLRIRGAPGTKLAVEIPLVWPASGYRLVYRDAATAGADGVAELRVPYATRSPNGSGRVAGSARWTFGRSGGELAIDDRAVRAGAEVELR